MANTKEIIKHIYRINLQHFFNCFSDNMYLNAKLTNIKLNPMIIKKNVKKCGIYLPPIKFTSNNYINI